MARRAIVVVLCALALGACKVDAQVDVTLREDGRGTVRTTITLDKDAVARLTKADVSLANAVRLDDLRHVGWDVSRWTALDNGGARVTLTSDYVGERELAQRIRDLAGPDGALRDVRLTRERSFQRSEDSVSLVADLRNITTGIKGDAELVANLQAAGLDVDTLDAQLQTDLRDALNVKVVLHAPGGHEAGRELHAGQRATITATRSTTNDTRVRWLGGAALLGVIALALLVTASVSARRSRVRRAKAETPPTM